MLGLHAALHAPDKIEPCNHKQFLCNAAKKFVQQNRSDSIILQSSATFFYVALEVFFLIVYTI